MMFIDSDSDSSNGTAGISVSTLDAIYLATLFQENNVEGSEEVLVGTEEGLVRTEEVRAESLVETEKLLKEKSTTEKLQEIFNLPNREELKGGTLVINF